MIDGGKLLRRLKEAEARSMGDWDRAFAEGRRSGLAEARAIVEELKHSAPWIIDGEEEEAYRA